MKTFIITYDLGADDGKPDQGYPALHAALNAAGAVREQGSVWHLDTEDDQQTSGSLKQALSHHLDSNDKMIVAELKISPFDG